MGRIRRVVALHGYTQTGEAMRPSVEGLVGPDAAVEVVCPDAPWAARSEGRTWWRATDDGSLYEGWETSRDAIAALIEPGTAVLGFSQGAMLAACLAAWSERGDVPALVAVALVAGAVPRADALKSLFETPIAVPSLHVWGLRDPSVERAEALASRFTAAERVAWDGPHVLPTRGPGADALRARLKART